MIRFWPTGGIVCLLAGFLALVVSGLWSALHSAIIDPQGQWLGRLPLDGADDCRIRLMPTDQFDLECKGATKYAAQGSWIRSGPSLTMTFRWLTRDEKPVEKPSPWEFHIDGVRNGLCVGLPTDRGEPYCWHRATP